MKGALLTVRVVQVCTGKQTVVIPTSGSSSTLPSVVGIGDAENIVVGAAAKRYASIPEHLAQSPVARG